MRELQTDIKALQEETLKNLKNSKFIKNAPDNVIQGEKNKLDDVLKKIEIIKQTISKKN